MPAESLENNRYYRQLLLREVGVEGQQKLAKSRILVIGTGGLGSPVLYYLAAAGVGTLGLLDNDRVDITNLQRQILHGEKDLGRYKIDSAKDKLSSFNSTLTYIPYPVRFTKENALEIIQEFDLVVAAVDNVETRIILNRACYRLGKPWIDGGIREFIGALSVFLPPNPPCYECFYRKQFVRPEGPIPLLGTMPGVIGCLEAMEAIKLTLSIGSVISGRVLLYDALEGRFEEFMPEPNPTCSICGNT